MIDNHVVLFSRSLRDAILVLPETPVVSGNRPVSATPASTHVQPASALNQDRQFVLNAVKQIVELTEDMANENRRALSTLEQVAIELAIAAAGHVVFQKIQDEQFPIAEIVADFLKGFDVSTPLEVLVHPLDLRQLHAAREADNELSAQLSQLTLTGDPSLPRGSVRLSDDSSGLFFSVATQLSEIRQELMEKLYDAKIERRTIKDSDSALRRFPDRRATG